MAALSMDGQVDKLIKEREAKPGDERLEEWLHERSTQGLKFLARGSYGAVYTQNSESPQVHNSSVLENDAGWVKSQK